MDMDQKYVHYGLCIAYTIGEHSHLNKFIPTFILYPSRSTKYQVRGTFDPSTIVGSSMETGDGRRETVPQSPIHREPLPKVHLIKSSDPS